MKTKKVEEYFHIYYGDYFSRVDDYEKGNTPVVKSQGVDNGIIDFLDIEPNYKYIITVARTGSVGSTFFQKNNCYVTDDCIVLVPKCRYSELQMLIFVTLIGKEAYKYSYARKVTPERLKNTRIPVIENFVETIIIPSLPSKASMINQKIKIGTCIFSSYKTIDIFSEIYIAPSIDLNKLKIDDKGVNYIGRTRENNGKTNSVAYTKELNRYLIKGNCITIAMVGDSTCYAFYQESTFLSSQNILILRNDKLNKYNAMFINTILLYERYRFSYGRTLTKTYFENMEIRLPSDKYGNPDYIVMENYIKSLPYSISM